MAYLARSYVVDKKNLEASTTTPPTNELPTASTMPSSKRQRQRRHKFAGKIIEKCRKSPIYIYLPEKNIRWEKT